MMVKKDRRMYAGYSAGHRADNLLGPQSPNNNNNNRRVDIMKTPYEKHQDLAGHPTTRHSPDGFLVVEECSTCGQRWILPNFVDGNQYPISIGKREDIR